MELITFAIIGIVVGAAGSEALRAKAPKVIEKVEDAARRFAERLCPSKSRENAAAEAAGQDAVESSTQDGNAPDEPTGEQVSHEEAEHNEEDGHQGE